MPNYMTLMGSEEVSRASVRMAEAADRMSMASCTFDESVTRMLRGMEEHVCRIEKALENSPAGITPAVPQAVARPPSVFRPFVYAVGTILRPKDPRLHGTVKVIGQFLDPESYQRVYACWTGGEVFRAIPQHIAESEYYVPG